MKAELYSLTNCPMCGHIAFTWVWPWIWLWAALGGRYRAPCPFCSTIITRWI